MESEKRGKNRLIITNSVKKQGKDVNSTSFLFLFLAITDICSAISRVNNIYYILTDIRSVKVTRTGNFAAVSS